VPLFSGDDNGVSRDRATIARQRMVKYIEFTGEVAC
jgi:hypothetical protein